MGEGTRKDSTTPAGRLAVAGGVLRGTQTTMASGELPEIISVVHTQRCPVSNKMAAEQSFLVLYIFPF
mgnify:FL=1